MNYPEEARDLLVRLARYANTLTPHKLDDPIDPLVAAALDQALSQLCELVRESVGSDDEISVKVEEYNIVPKAKRFAVTRTHGIESNELREAIRTKWTLKENE